MKDKELIRINGQSLFDRVVSILEQAHSNVLRAVNSNMVIAYWLIGREIVNEIQGGKERAKYGKQVIDKLSEHLTEKYGRGFSSTNLRYFRSFCTVYAGRIPEIRHIGCGELSQDAKHHIECGVLETISSAIEMSEKTLGFSPELGWSHYRLLMKISNQNERLFYEIEAEKADWDVNHMERQITTFLFARLLKSKDKTGVMELANQGQTLETATDIIKSPYIFDFLGLPDLNVYHETELENAIIDNLQSFLLELGKGFAFAGRQKRLRFDDEYFYVDLVFYNCILKCYLLIDLKIGKLTHQDIGQMDSYIRMFDDKYITDDDNPTIGLILCAKHNETIAKYSVLKDNKQLFASKYLLYLPSEEELKQEIEKEYKLLEANMK